MRRQVGSQGGEIVVVKMEFISELIVEIFFEGGRIKGDAVGQTNFGEV